MNNDNKLEIQYRPTSDLMPYARNTRTHSDEQIAEVAASIQEYGFTNPVLIDGENGLIAGHGRLLAAIKIGLKEVPVIELAHLSDTQKRAYIIADNKLAEKSGWDDELLALELGELAALDYDVSLTGFSGKDIKSITDAALKASADGLTDKDDIPEAAAADVSTDGDVWILGSHRVMCGDSTSAENVATLMAGQTAALMHADPPYGMGKQSDGVANDNLYREKLDEFQMAWWRTFRPHLSNNASAYIWGNPAELWRLWYSGGLEAEEEFTFCNQIVWDKKCIPGMNSDDRLRYAPGSTESCLFFQFGKQFIGNINTADYWEGWEGIRGYLSDQASQAGLTPKRSREITGVQMHSHWFSKCQWSFIPEKHYQTLQAAHPGFFEKDYRELRQEYEEIKGGYRNHINGMQGGMRSYFDNVHDTMRDVWEFPRVVGEERHGHATPKPVDMMARVMMSSLPEGGLCAEPFGGSGSTLMGAERTNRKCYTMEMQEMYVDVIVRRWQNYTGSQAYLERNGKTFSQIESERGPVI